MLRITASIVALCVSSGGVFAADLNRYAPPPQLPAAAPLTWSGFFIGGFAGGGYEASRAQQNFQGIGGNDVGAIPGIVPSTQPLTSTTYSAGNDYALGLATWDSWSYTPVSYPAFPNSFGDNAGRFFGLVGVEAGYQQQFGALVLGVAADFAFKSNGHGRRDWDSAGNYAGSGIDYSYSIDLEVNGTVNSQVNGTATAFGSTSATMPWLGTVRATAGVAMDRFMVYGTGGLAYGQVRLSSSASWIDSSTYTCAATGVSSCAGLPVGTSETVANWSGSRSTVRYGYVAGGGFAYAMTHNWVMKFEALYFDLGTERLTVNGSGTRTVTGDNIPAPNTSEAVSVSSYTVDRRFDGVLAKIGLSYRF